MSELPGGPLRVEGVSLRAGGKTILDDVGLELHPGGMCALIGPSGAGKSTLIRVLLGLREAESGTVTLPTGTGTGTPGTVGYVPQEDAGRLKTAHRLARLEPTRAFARRFSSLRRRVACGCR